MAWAGQAAGLLEAAQPPRPGARARQEALPHETQLTGGQARSPQQEPRLLQKRARTEPALEGLRTHRRTPRSRMPPRSVPSRTPVTTNSERNNLAGRATQCTGSAILRGPRVNSGRCHKSALCRAPVSPPCASTTARRAHAQLSRRLVTEATRPCSTSSVLSRPGSASSKGAAQSLFGICPQLQSHHSFTF